jgi:hypothetical protein
VGFYIYRLVTTDTVTTTTTLTDFVPLTGLIVSQGENGGIYTFTDEDYIPGQGYSYMPVERKADGTLVKHSAFIVPVGASQLPLDKFIFIPLINKAAPTPNAAPTIDPRAPITLTEGLTTTLPLTLTEDLTVTGVISETRLPLSIPLASGTPAIAFLLMPTPITLPKPTEVDGA